MKQPVKSEEASKIRGHFREIYGGESSVQRDFYAEFMRRMQATQKRPIDESYARTWAERFKRGDEFQFSDGKHRQILLDIMADENGLGDGTNSHLDKEDVKKFCQRHAENKGHSRKKMRSVS